MYGKDPDGNKSQRCVRADVLSQFKRVQTYKASKATLYLKSLAGFNLFTFIGERICAYQKSPQTEIACVCCASLPYAKNTAAWDKRSPWASARDERGKALAYAEPLLTQHAVFIKWLLGRDRNSQTECENVTTVWFKFLLYGQTVNLAQVAKPPIILLHSGQSVFQRLRLRTQTNTGAGLVL